MLCNAGIIIICDVYVIQNTIIKYKKNNKTLSVKYVPEITVFMVIIDYFVYICCMFPKAYSWSN